MRDLSPMVPAMKRCTREYVDGYLTRADELANLGQYGDAAEQLRSAAHQYDLLAHELDRLEQA
jgi:hypothetical protein